jgi:hypothetical protein
MSSITKTSDKKLSPLTYPLFVLVSHPVLRTDLHLDAYFLQQVSFIFS